MEEFIQRTVHAYQDKISPGGCTSRDADALRQFCEENPGADPVYGEKAVLEAARQMRYVPMSYVLAIAGRLAREGQADAGQRSDDYIRAYRARQRDRGQAV